jgi:hypothetical protein
MDDLVVYSRSLTEHLGHLAEVFKRLKKAGFTLNADKLRMAQADFLSGALGVGSGSKDFA